MSFQDVRGWSIEARWRTGILCLRKAKRANAALNGGRRKAKAVFAGAVCPTGSTTLHERPRRLNVLYTFSFWSTRIVCVCVYKATGRIKEAAQNASSCLTVKTVQQERKSFCFNRENGWLLWIGINYLAESSQRVLFAAISLLDIEW